MSNLPYWLAALYLPDVGARIIKRWLEDFSDIKSLFQASDEEWEKIKITEEQSKSLRQPNWERVEGDLEWLNKNKENHIITLDDPAYPKSLKEISDPPILLFVRGNIHALDHKQIAIVGARNATPTGINNAEYFARVLAEAGFAITSGLALGIDGACHRGALASKGITIAVCGTGLNYLYPKSHRPLAEKIIQQQGALISEFPLHSPPSPKHFPQRNRVIAGMSKGVLVVEAALKSGSLITARHAMEQGREVFAIPGSIHNPLARGCHHLIRQGAKLVETREDILEEFGVQEIFSLVQSSIPTTSLVMREQKLLDQIEYEITPMDMILLRSGLTAGEVSSILLVLELNGYIQSVPGGYIRESKVDKLKHV